MTVVERYADRAVRLLRESFEANAAVMEQVADTIARTLAADGAVHVFGGGHSQLVALDIADRAGGLRGVRPLVDPRLSPVAGPTGAALEHRPDEAAGILDSARMQTGDLLVVVSHSGVNPLPVELAIEAARRGHPVVAVTSVAHATSVPARHASGQRLPDVADLVLDTLVPLGDASLDIESGGRVGPLSTVGAVALLTATLARTAELLDSQSAARARAEHMPIRSRNVTPQPVDCETDLLVTDVRLPSELPGETGCWLAVAGGRVVDQGTGEPPYHASSVVDGRGGWLLPGFVDVHVHGAAGHDTMDADPDGLREIARFHARHGVTALLPTTWAASPEATASAVRAVADTMGPVPGGATILGAHLEGPWLHRDRCGAQDPDQIRVADAAEVHALLDTGAVRLVTVAPEVPGNALVLEACRARGIATSIGHTDADHDAAMRAVASGITHATHCFNAMRGFGHRDPGTVGAVLTHPGVTCEVVADNVHVHPSAMKLLLAAKGIDGVVLVSDAVSVTGLPQGRHALGGRPVDVEGGEVRLADGSLAGSVLTLDVALRNLREATGEDVDTLWPATSRNAAAVAGVAGRKGTLQPGADADFVLLDLDRRVVVTAVGGLVVHDARRGNVR